jgi:hypothetical protein
VSQRGERSAEYDADAFTTAPRFRLEDFNTLTVGAIFWLVKKLWPMVGVCFVYGPSGSGKSFWVLDICARICRGLLVLGRKSVAAGVVYIASEDPDGIRLRIEGLRKKIGALAEDRFKFIGNAPDLRDDDDLVALRAAILEARDLMASHGDRLGLVVIDTLSASTPGADENLAKDMGPVLWALQDLARELVLLIVVIAHPGKDEAKKIRGWSGLLANADGVIFIENLEGSDVRGGRIEKVKNGPAGASFGFRLERVVVGKDAEGEDIDTCVIQEADPPEPKKAGRKPTKASATGELILKALHLCLDYCAVPVHAIGAIGLQGVEVRHLREEAYRIGLGPSEPDIPPGADAEEQRRARRSWQDKRKVDFDRGLQHELASGRLRQHGNVVWETFAKRGG